MNTFNTLIGKTLTAFLVIFGLATCGAVIFAIDAEWGRTVAFKGLVTIDPTAVPAIRHWGMMVFGIGVLMIAAAFLPWLRFSTMLYSMIEKAFMVYLYVSNVSHDWSAAYLAGSVIDATIVIYSILYFISSHGRPQRWRSASVPS